MRFLSLTVCAILVILVATTGCSSVKNDASGNERAAVQHSVTWTPVDTLYLPLQAGQNHYDLGAIEVSRADFHVNYCNRPANPFADRWSANRYRFRMETVGSNGQGGLLVELYTCTDAMYAGDYQPYQLLFVAYSGNIGWYNSTKWVKEDLPNLMMEPTKPLDRCQQLISFFSSLPMGQRNAYGGAFDATILSPGLIKPEEFTTLGLLATDRI
ncbi:MAG: hypothetical protein PHH01_02665 [Patescibacteria group bacterium]|nr:hypothetical protein [Patescibacteria group bacterium]